MTLSAATQRNDYTGNGATSVYPYTFKIFATSDLIVTKADTSSPPVETALALTTDFTVDNSVGNVNGGNITLVAGALPNGYHLTITRRRPLTQTLDIRNQGEYFPETLEDEYDMIVMIAQQLQEQLNRAVLFKKTSLKSGFNMDDPVAGNLLGWDATGLRLTNYTASPSSSSSYSPPVNGFTQAGFVQQAIDALNARTHGSRATPTLLTAAGVSADAGVIEQVWYVAGNGAPIDLTAVNPPIAAGTLVGQKIELNGCHDTNTILIGGTGTPNIATNGIRTLKNGTTLGLRWDGTQWHEIYFNNL